MIILQKRLISYIAIYLLGNQKSERCLFISIRSWIKIRLIITLLIRFYLKRKQIHTIADIQLPIGSKSYTTKWEHVIQRVFQGETALFLDGDDHVLLLDTQGWPQRAIAEPQIESCLRVAPRFY